MNIQDALLRGLVPAGRPDAGVPARPLTEADFARSYVGYSDLFGVQPTWATFFERLQDLGLQPTMAALSFLNSWLYLKGGIQAQAEIIGSTFDLDLALIRFRGHVPKGGYDVPNGEGCIRPASPATVL
jgi:hypothetical protein